MRLTLRTLLAYLDDVLEPSQTKEIGQKIQESPVASALMNRVRDVVRRRRLGAPEVEVGSGTLDPNLVAQYLDNTLPEKDVADIERICLESDLHLAEVAACHQILTLVLGEPVEISQARRDRFYALGPMPSSDVFQAPNEAGKGAAAAKLAVADPASSHRASSNGIPDYLKPVPWTRRYAPAMGLMAVVVAAAAALFLDKDLSRTLLGTRPDVKGPNVAQGDTGKKAEGPTVVATSPQTSTATSPTMTATSPAPASTKTTSNDDPAAMVTGLPPDIDPAAPADADAPAVAASNLPRVIPPAATSPTPPVMVAEAGKLPPATLPEKGATPTVKTPDKGEPVTDPGAPRPAPVVVPWQYVSTEGVLLRYERSDQHWYVAGRKGELQEEDRVATPDLFEAEIDADHGQATVKLFPESSLEILPATPTQRIRLRIIRGRLLLSMGKSASESVTVEVADGDESWFVKLSGEQPQCAFEKTFAQPAGLPFPPPLEVFVISAIPVQGAVDIFGVDGQALIPAGDGYWLHRRGAMINEAPVKRPDWIASHGQPLTPAVKRNQLLFEREFSSEEPIDLLMPPRSREPRPKIAELATRCLATLESAEDLVQTLGRSEHAEARAAAAQGLRTWLIQDEARAGTLKELLSRQYGPAEQEAISRLLIGFTPQDAKDRQTSVMIVEWLRSSFVEVRELAFEQLERLAGRRYDYRPLGSPSQREPGIQRWLGHIEKEGALVKPDPVKAE